MTTCSKCGVVVDDGLAFCPSCGAYCGDVNNNQSQANNQNNNWGSPQGFTNDWNNNQSVWGTSQSNTQNSVTGYNDNVNILVNILGFFFPIIGITFLAFIWKDCRNTKKYGSLATCIAISCYLSLLTSILVFFAVLLPSLATVLAVIS